MHTRLTKVLCVFLLAWIVPAVSGSTNNHGPYSNRHAELAKRAEGDVQLFKRITGTHWTYYDVETGNAGSCGLKHVNTDFTVAMNAAQMNPAWCFKTITLTQGGKTTTATISDVCDGCPYGGLDLTKGLFAFFVGYWPTGGGTLTGDWDFTDAAPAKPAAPTTKSASPPPVTSTVPKSAISSTYISSTHGSSTEVSSANTSISTASASVTSTSVSSSASTSVNYLSGAASGLAIPTGSIDTTGSPSNLVVLNSIFVQIGGLTMAASNI